MDDCNIVNGRPLHYRPSPVPDSSHLMKHVVTEETVESVVISEVASTLVIDLHTHLLPPSHGALCLWGIDELLTYVRMTRAETHLFRFTHHHAALLGSRILHYGTSIHDP